MGFQLQVERGVEKEVETGSSLTHPVTRRTRVRVRGGSYSAVECPLSLPMDRLQLLVSGVGGLLASSCCLVQLVLNAFSVGCAGFSVLDGYRPVFLGLTLVGLVASQWYHTSRTTGGDKRVAWWRAFFTPRFVLVLGLACALSASPLLLERVNDIMMMGGPSASPSHDEMVWLELTGVPCESCRNRAIRVLSAMEGVVRCEVELEDKQMKRAKAVVYLSGPPRSNEDILNTLEGAGIGGKVVERRPSVPPMKAEL